MEELRNVSRSNNTLRTQPGDITISEDFFSRRSLVSAFIAF